MTVSLVDKIAWPVSSNYSIKPDVDTVGKGGYSLLSSAAADPDAVIKALFANNEQGAWYDPSDFSTMFQDSAGTTPVTAVGQSVGRINDKSGRGNNALQATAAARPVLSQDANSKYYLEFDGVDDLIESASVVFSGNYMGVFKGVFSTNATGGGFDYAIGEAGTQGRADSYFNASGSNTLELISGGLVNATTISVGQSTPAVISCLMNITGAAAPDRIKARLNGTVPAQTASGGAIPNPFGSNPIRLGGLIGGNKGAVRIYALIIRNAASTTQEITDTETWVNGKTGAY